MLSLNKKTKVSQFSTANPQVRRTFLASFSSDAILAITVNIIIITAILISLIFVRVIKDFLVSNRTTTVSSLIAQQEKRHLGTDPLFSTWNQEDSQKKFRDLEDEVLGSYRNIAAMNLYTPQGVLVRTSLRNPALGAIPGKREIEEVLSGQKVYSPPDPLIIHELNIKNLLKIYAPIHNKDGRVVGVAEVYLNLDDIVVLTQYIQMILWGLIIISAIIIYCLLRLAFRYRDTQISTRTQELTKLTKNLEKKVIERTKTIEEEKINLKKARERYLSALENMLEGCTIINHHWKFTYLNYSAVKHVRKERKDLIGHTLTEMYPGIETTEMYHAYHRTMTERVSQRLETSYTFPDGYTGWYDISINPIPEGIFILTIDITEHKKSAEILLKLNTAIQSSGEALFMTDLQGIITFINPAFANLYGYTAEEVVGKTTPRILKSGKQSAEYYKTFWANITQGRVANNEIINKAKAGHLIDIHEVVNPIVDTNEHIGYIAAHRDITERKRIEDALKARDNALELANQALSIEKRIIEDEKVKDEALLTSLGEGMFAIDSEGLITAMNHAAEKMLVWQASEVLGKKLTDAVPATYENGDAISPEERICLITATKGIPTKTTDGIYLIKKNGEKIPVAITVNPVIIDNKTVGAVVIFRDITQEKELEETRKNLLSLASHQLRTPLSGTKWLIETLKKGLKGPLSEGQIEYLDEIYNINVRMSSLVQDMMEILRIEDNVDQAHRERVSVASIFYTLLETLNAAIKSKEITLHLPDDLGDEVTTDQLMLRTILECLVSNAINYSKPKGEVTVSIEKKAGELVLAIKDFGIGIPKEEQSHIFERFYRASNAKTFDAHGTGLGLYVASMLAKKIGVLLSFESEENMGTTFYVHVPYSDSE